MLSSNTVCFETGPYSTSQGALKTHLAASASQVVGWEGQPLKHSDSDDCTPVRSRKFSTLPSSQVYRPDHNVTWWLHQLACSHQKLQGLIIWSRNYIYLASHFDLKNISRTFGQGCQSLKASFCVCQEHTNSAGLTQATAWVRYY